MGLGLGRQWQGRGEGRPQDGMVWVGGMRDPRSLGGCSVDEVAQGGPVLTELGGSHWELTWFGFSELSMVLVDIFGKFLRYREIKGWSYSV